MSSPASTRSDLVAATADTFFGQREALVSRSPIRALSQKNKRILTVLLTCAQPLTLRNRVSVPNTVLSGQGCYATHAEAVDVVAASNRSTRLAEARAIGIRSRELRATRSL